MRIPDSVVVAYEEAMAVIEPLQEIAGSRLREMCEKRKWLFDHRPKGVQSSYSKLETGAARLADLHDMYAATVVVPTMNELDDAIKAVLENFTGTVQPPRSGEPDVFVYDDIHVHAQLDGKISPVGTPEAVRKRTFEIQIKTGLQFAWWRATHEQIYKPSDGSGQAWEVLRASHQARASLELLDSVLADLAGAAKLQRPHQSAISDFGEYKRYLDRWGSDQQPDDVLRFVSTATRLLTACSVTIERAIELLTISPISQLVEANELPPGQVLIAILLEESGDDMESFLLNAKLKVLITDELLRDFPKAARLAEAVRARA